MEFALLLSWPHWVSCMAGTDAQWQQKSFLNTGPLEQKNAIYKQNQDISDIGTAEPLYIYSLDLVLL